jgi:hypothetical protein
MHFYYISDDGDHINVIEGKTSQDSTQRKTNNNVIMNKL